MNCKWYLLSHTFLTVSRAKYPLAVVFHLLKALGKGLCGGYDIGCKLTKTINNSRLRDLANELQFVSVVGLFHGHAHNRRCQLRHLGTYLKGMGIEDLEGCEQFFARTNDLAALFRYGSAFHRRQALCLFFEHLDEGDTYDALSECIMVIYKDSY